MDENFDELAEVRAKADELAAVKEMAGSRGWSVIKKHFSLVIKQIQDGLAYEEDFEKIKRLQERLRAFYAMLETVETFCDEHSKVLLQLDDIENDKLEREQYGQP